MSNRDYYEVLGISRDAAEADIKKAYRQLARQYHPDVAKDNPAAAEKFKEINEAYEVLSDTDKRARYDQFGHAGTQPGAEGFGGFGGGGGGGGGDFGMGDIFDMFFGGGMRGGQRPNGPQRGADLRFDLTLTFEEAAFGVERDVQVPRLENCATCGGSGARPGTHPATCKVCHGTGQVQVATNTAFGRFVSVRTCDHCHGEGRFIESPCPDCQGSGRVRKQRKLSVKVPAGLESGSRLRISGEGEAGERGGPPGDLFIFISVKPHSTFRRKENDVVVEVPISFVQATLGAEVEVPTLDGPVKLKIPEGTQAGTVFRLRGKGIPHLRGHGRGDEHVRVMVMTPTRLTDEERRMLRQFADLRGEDVTPEERSFLKRMRDAFGV
ncbi:MAG: molecular chaperone DnaJ [Symbiobacteriia bacterium]